ncbi:MAG: endonuclease NucS [Acidimicrobiales bacterium]|nr:endonuclease NucS [Acidimicrobiales bacterium]
MRLVIARCTVNYAGRLTAYLPEAIRLLMVKADGCVAIHADGGAYKPLNWMNAPNTLTIEDFTTKSAINNESNHDEKVKQVWSVRSPKGESLTINIVEVIAELDQEMGIDPGLVKDGVEAHLQKILAADPTSIEEGLRLVRREFPTDIGPVDLLCRDTSGAAVAIEVKRRGDIDGVEQLTRYLAFLNRDPMLRPVRGIFVAQEIKPQARVLALDRSMGCVVIDYDELRGIESDELKLF